MGKKKSAPTRDPVKRASKESRTKRRKDARREAQAEREALNKRKSDVGIPTRWTLSKWKRKKRREAEKLAA